MRKFKIVNFEDYTQYLLIEYLGDDVYLGECDHGSMFDFIIVFDEFAVITLADISTKIETLKDEAQEFVDNLDEEDYPLFVRFEKFQNIIKNHVALDCEMEVYDNLLDLSPEDFKEDFLEHLSSKIYDMTIYWNNCYDIVQEIGYDWIIQEIKNNLGSDLANIDSISKLAYWGLEFAIYDDKSYSEIVNAYEYVQRAV